MTRARLVSGDAGSSQRRPRRAPLRTLARALATLALAGCAALVAPTPPASAQPADRSSAPLPRDFARQSYRVSEFVLEYALDAEGLPELAELRDLEVGLLFAYEGFHAPRSVDVPVLVRIGELPPDRPRFYATALVRINQAIVEELNQRGIGGVLVTVPDIEDGSGRDLRLLGDTRLRLRIWTGRVSSVASVADGDRFDDLDAADRTNMDEHAWIREGAPVQPGGEKGLLRVDELDEYAWRLSRHPGRRVDVELSPGNAPGATHVDLQVAENRPWSAYFQFANDGTPGTGKQRERFGFVHNQLTGRDDIFRLDYVTGNFQTVHGVRGSYEIPWDRADGPRFELAGSYSTYTAETLGFDAFDFEGDGWSLGLDSVYTAYQRGQLFIDVFGGARWQHVRVENPIFAAEAQDDYFLPRIGVRLERDTITSTISVETSFEFNLDGVANTQDAAHIDPLTGALSSVGAPELMGTLDSDAGFQILFWDARWSFYLEPLIDPVAWNDPHTPGSSTLAHELVGTFWGQWSVGNRVVPQFQQPVGGLYTVRGYPQALVAGDTAILASWEYRFHLPRVLWPNAKPSKFPVVGDVRTVPPHVYGLPDWDLILLAFADYGNIRYARPFIPEERPVSLGSVGVGIELQFMRNLSVRTDVGVALWEANGLANTGDVEAHVVLSLFY